MFWSKYTILLALVLTIVSCREQSSKEIVIACGAVGIELELCQSGAQIWSKQTGFPVRVVTAAASSGDRLSNTQLLLAAHSPDIDVFVIDTPWPGVIGDFFLDLKKEIPPEVLSDYFPGFIENNTVNGRLVALPWFIDGGLLYYRKDLLEKHSRPVPSTWKELTETAEHIQKEERAAGNGRLWGFVFQGRAYEGLTCNAFEWIMSWGGGTILDERGEITIDNPKARQALELAASWIGRISPPGVLNYMEEESRGVFQSGHALFMRSWPYAWKLAQAPDSPVRGKVGLTVLPKGEGEGARPAATLGGWSLAVSRFSRYPKEAIALATFLASKPELKRRALEGGLSPTMRSLFDDREILASNPLLRDLFPVFMSAVPRPSRIAGPQYNRVSREFYDTVHTSLSTGRVELEKLKETLERVRRRGGWKNETNAPL